MCIWGFLGFFVGKSGLFSKMLSGNTAGGSVVGVGAASDDGGGQCSGSTSSSVQLRVVCWLTRWRHSRQLRRSARRDVSSCSNHVSCWTTSLRRQRPAPSHW